jgi:hypothetical protein
VRTSLVGAFVLVLLLGACTADSDPDTTATTRQGAADPSGTEEAGDAKDDEADASEWVQHAAAEPCRCADGSEFSYWSRTADTDRVVLYFQGGGACFSAETCNFEDGTYSVQADVDLSEDSDREPSGIFDFSNDSNPFRDWSFVFVPYCTGDVHIGNNVQAYSDDLEVNHVGFVNANHGLDHLVANFPDASDVFVTGSSAGGVPAPLFGALVADSLPDADVAVLADASGAYPDNPPINAGIGALWGTTNIVPDWPVNEGMQAEDFSIPGLFTQAGLHAPEVRMGRYDNAYDEVQESFSLLSEIGGGDELQVILANEAGIEEAGVPIHSYIAPGNDHTILGRSDLYTLEVEGVSFLDWLTRFVDGDDVDDVQCVECGESAILNGG